MKKFGNRNNSSANLPSLHRDMEGKDQLHLILMINNWSAMLQGFFFGSPRAQIAADGGRADGGVDVFECV